jgi:hypothetical protein
VPFVERDQPANAVDLPFHGVALRLGDRKAKCTEAVVSEELRRDRGKHARNLLREPERRHWPCRQCNLLETLGNDAEVVAVLVLKLLHILAMFGAVTLIVGSIVFLDLVGRSRDIVAYRRLDAVVQRTDVVAVGLFVAGIVLGVLTALAGGIDLTAGWLILAYVLVGALFIEGFLFTLPWYAKIREAANDTDDARAASDVERLLRTPHHVVLVTVIVLLWAGVIFVMVVKPNPF